MPKKDRRLSIPSIGVYYNDLLTLDAAINDRSIPVQAQSLLCAKLQEREARINERLQYMADKFGITIEQMREKILSGEYESSED
ncbi:hypothetical protein [Chroococcidiopsis sp.]|uniref:hypothetical protein n=1 Tax=Chroococcidiopsis sp. TaxID=3088168 RepID=UPI003F37BE82